MGVEDFGKNLASFRRKQGLSQADLAARIGVKWQTIGRYERGETNVTLDRVGEIATALGVSDSDLLGETA